MTKHVLREVFRYRNGLSTDNKKISFAEMMTDDEQISREERCFRLWINSLGISSYVNNLFEDVRNGWAVVSCMRNFGDYINLRYILQNIF